MFKYVVAALAAILLVLLLLNFFGASQFIFPAEWGVSSSPRNAEYIIDQMPVTLTDGRAQMPAAPGSASQVVTEYFGNEAKGDLNADGIVDMAMLLTQSSGGTGTFFYVSAALQDTNGKYYGLNAVLLGDRIAPQTTEIRDGKIIVNYADRKPGEPMTTRPSVGVSKYFYLANNWVTEE